MSALSPDIENIDDPSSLTGMAKIVNKRKVNLKLDLEAIERELMTGPGGLQPMKVTHPNQELADILRDIRTEPINSQIYKSPSNRQELVTHQVQPTTTSARLQSFVSRTNPVVPPIFDDEQIEDNEIYNPDEGEPENHDYSEDPEYSEDSDYVENNIQTPIMPPRPAYYPPAPRTEMYKPQPEAPAPMYRSLVSTPTYMPANTTQLNYQPGYQPMPAPVPGHYAQEALQAYSGDIATQENLAEQERLEDQKEKMIADIEELREELEAEGINISRIPEVNMDSPYPDVLKVYKQIKRKYDRSRCEDLGQNVLLAGARMVEMVFDGKKSYFGHRPDMTGWNRTVRSKMRRMRYEQSVIVSNALEYYNVGPIQRMGLELIPSAFLYSLTRKEQHGSDNYTPNGNNTTDDDRAGALNDLIEFDN